MASEIRVNKLNSQTGVGTITLSPTGVDISGVTTVSTLRSNIGIFSGTITGEHHGDGSNLTGVASTENIRTNTNATFLQNINVSGTVTATSYAGDGSALTGLPTTDDVNNLISNVAILGFKIATNGSLAKYSLVNQVIDEFADATGIDASASTNELLQSGYYTGTTSSTGNATGGTISTTGGYTYHYFPHTGAYNGASSGSYSTSYDFVVPGTGTLEYLIVGGGGRGQSSHNGWNQSGNSAGGEGGDTSNNTSFSATAQTYTIIVGGGGEGWTSSNSNAGAASTAFGVTADGGAANASTSYNNSHGQQYTNFSQFGEQVDGGGWFGGDGGYGGTGVGVGGKGGGGDGGSGGTHSTSGDSHTGGGGGGAGGANAAGNGGSGVVLVRYSTNAFTTTVEGGDLTLQSVDTTAVDGAPTKADLILLMENAAGTATLNTDIKGFISRDSGTTFTQGTLVDEGSYATSTKRIVAFHDLDISGQPSGTSVCYKITTHNQSSGSKTTRVHAVSHGWK